MKNLKTFGLAAIAAMALSVFVASSASATTLEGGAPERVLGNGDTIDFSIPSGKSAVLVNTNGEEIDKCSTSTVKGKLSSGTTGAIEELTWGSCTFATLTIIKGRLEVVSTGATNGTVKADATIAVTINTVLFGSCIYGVESGTAIGTLAGKPAGFSANAVVKKLEGPAACPETARWTGTYNSTEPANFHVES